MKVSPIPVHVAKHIRLWIVIAYKSGCCVRQWLENSNLSPIESDALLDYYYSPYEAREDFSEILDRLIHQVDGPFLENQIGFGYGIEVQEGLNYGRLRVVRILVATIWLVFGIIWSCAKKDPQPGFTITGFLLVFSDLCANALK
ncbi:hypothetical protein CGLO_02761 [Colletotrichum gloeosporioides Cg-14]|uniref:Uncharacterized protein n=1 Tax=Colletotrichum gloeosporioides (strain Cg-14) TaxID=1237896 RepID=T0KY56_COLGC|nr:hypothetical protein CGLO_02761 [Colletotrichum gloeosporioides Cg-14]